MPSLPWSEALELGLPAMDDTHREFVELLGRARTIDDDALRAAWKVLIEHTETHFAQEEAWMRATHFESSSCHTMHHNMILRVMREGADRAAQGDITPVRLMTRELAMWFPEHAQTMDAALAAHLQRVGYDPATGTMNAPDQRPPEQTHGCGGKPCCGACETAAPST
jgi:hemerythrin-like metal-binding protein